MSGPGTSTTQVRCKVCLLLEIHDVLSQTQGLELARKHYGHQVLLK